LITISNPLKELQNKLVKIEVACEEAEMDLEVTK
jgi:hypothetical protein